MMSPMAAPTAGRVARMTSLDSAESGIVDSVSIGLGGFAGCGTLRSDGGAGEFEQDGAGGRAGEVGDGDGVEGGVERLLGASQCAPEAAPGAQRTRLVALAGDDLVVAFELPGEPSDGGGPAEFGDGQSAAAAAAGRDDAEFAQSCDHLGGVGVRQLQLLGNASGTGGAVGRGGRQVHDNSQSEIGELGELHEPRLDNCHPK
ncbi:hypothetical protein RHRU231_800100 [Rhodococcus ruber]|uniref:Uncharacterized protein n=1 Tax=Rhodococcus ruber TaxID=1830 RepID=A0A098BR31_9NOCA|nr:hypothetical protein RHRU231_800100 [Rhodococcus ruber]